VILREKVLRPILAGVGKRKTGRKPKNRSLIDEHYETIRQDIFTLIEDLGIAAKNRQSFVGVASVRAQAKRSACSPKNSLQKSWHPSRIATGLFPSPARCAVSSNANAGCSAFCRKPPTLRSGKPSRGSSTVLTSAPAASFRSRPTVVTVPTSTLIQKKIRDKRATGC
jgi:hypothetical protein